MGGTKHQNISFKGYDIIIQIDVDRGDTVLDYLKMERERGITITSAAITFKYEAFAL
jgi:translation elongation factor EF-G